MIAVERDQGAARPRAASAVVGVVFCGGESSRMGRDKARLELGGRSLLARAADLLRQLTPTVLLSSGPAPRYAELGLAEVQDERPGGGPLAGLAAALERAAESGADTWLLVLACDMPQAEAAVFRHLLATAEARGWDGCMLETGAGVEPLFAVYRARCLHAVRRALAAGERKMTSFHRAPGAEAFAAHDPRWRPAVGRLPEAELPAQLARCEPARNVNTPEDWRSVREEQR